jgi:hypothetical protein
MGKCHVQLKATSATSIKSFSFKIVDVVLILAVKHFNGSSFNSF